MKILKVINNNNVCVMDDSGKERILAGKGIGFGKKCGDSVDEEQVQKTYMITDSQLQERMISMLREIPDEYILFTNDCVEHIRETYPYSLNESLLVTLSDHIAFAIERMKGGMTFTNPLLDSIRVVYPLELKLGEYCTGQLKEKLGIEMDENEAGFIAMHIINARLDTKMSDVYDITKLINGCIEIAEYHYKKKFDRNSVYFERFQTHLKNMAHRLFRDEELPKKLSADADFYAMIKKTCAPHYKCAKRIQEYILKTYQKNIGDEELVTLTLHLKQNS